jgi:hypothetical protein
MKNLRSQLNRKIKYHLNCITELSTTDYDSIHGLSHSDHIQAVNTLREVLTQIKINEHYDSVNCGS